MSNLHWFIYALGAGWGHLTRSFALARAAVKQNVDCTILTNSEYSHEVEQSALFQKTCANWSAQIHIVQLPEDIKPANVSNRVEAELRKGDYSHLIVDTFPRGLVGDLAGFIETSTTKKVLIARDLNPAYVQKFDIEKYVGSKFCLVINPGETVMNIEYDSDTVCTSPWTVLDANELPPKELMRQRIGLTDPKLPVVIVCASGTLNETRFYTQLSERLVFEMPEIACRVLTALSRDDDNQSITCHYFPGIEIMSAADVIIGGAGYNTVAECEALGVPLIAFPQERLYDRQLKRAMSRKQTNPSSIAIVKDADKAIAALREKLESRSNGPAKPAFINGTHAAVTAILKGSY